ncbi:MFS transporter, partial [Actinomadura rubrisoli]|uniref:MFS transporter n=1 Tax=Actinomadura rubrisoli TaxID=2530368 RepID=UPI001A9D7BEB
MTATIDAPIAPPQTSPKARPENGSASPRRWLGLSAILAATLLNLLDSTVVNVAAPAIRADLGGSLAALQWMAAGYTLALAVALLTGGRLGDMFGRKPVLLAGAAGFLATSVACAFAWSPESLIAARVAQGLFAAVMVPQGFGLIRDLFGKDVGKAFALFGPVIGLATILGPVVAGLLIDADPLGTGWRAIFLLNVPVGAYALVVGARVLPAPSTTDRSGGLDVTGMLLGGTGMSMLVYPLVQGRELGWPAWSLALLAGSVPVLALFVLHQLRRGRSGRTPLVRLSMFADRSYGSGVLFVVVFFGTITGSSLAVGLFLQLGLGRAGVGPAARRLARHRGPRHGLLRGRRRAGRAQLRHRGRPGAAGRAGRGGRPGGRAGADHRRASGLRPGPRALRRARHRPRELHPRGHRHGHRRGRSGDRQGRRGRGPGDPRARRAGRRREGGGADPRAHRRRVRSRLPPAAPGARRLSTRDPSTRDRRAVTQSRHRISGGPPVPIFPSVYVAIPFSPSVETSLRRDQPFSGKSGGERDAGRVRGTRR